MNAAVKTEAMIHSTHDGMGPSQAVPRFVQAGEERIFRFDPIGRHYRAEVLVVHGLTDHPGRHFALAQSMAARGFGVTLFELAGHGGHEEPAERSAEIYRTYALSKDPELIRWSIGGPTPSRFFGGQYSRLQKTRIGDHQDQVDRLLTDVLPGLGNGPGKPLFLIGFSMGGLIAVDAALRWSRSRAMTPLDIRGTILLSPALRPQGQPSNRIQNMVINAAWSERNYAVAPIRSGVKTALRLNVKLDTSWGAPYMSDQPEEVELYRQDPLVPKAIPSHYASSIESLMAVVDPKAQDYPTDSLFLFPGEDGITSLTGGLSFARRVESARGGESCRIMQFHGIKAHDLTRSSVRSRVNKAILDWLEHKS